VYKLLLLLLLPGLAQSAIAQNYHQPHELVQIISDSKISYAIQASEAPIPAENFEDNLVLPGMYLEKDGEGRLSLANFGTRVSAVPEAVEALEKGEQAFAANDMELARKHYTKVLELFPDNALMLTYIGQTYEHEKRYDEAIEWLRKAIDANPIDYMAHWFLADNYAEKNELSLAIRHITMAHILNRNNGRLLYSLQNIYAKNGTPYDDWQFRPACSVDTTPDGKPLIIVDKNNMEWSIYAICKALWRFDPDYPQTVLGDTQEPDVVVAEREALINLAVGSANKNGENPSADPVINILTQTIHDRTFENFLYYEVVLRRYPGIAMLIPEETRRGFTEYIMKYHTKQ
jgi:tetratricopeptide (TPR) repeat protein